MRRATFLLTLVLALACGGAPSPSSTDNAEPQVQKVELTAQAGPGQASVSVNGSAVAAKPGGSAAPGRPAKSAEYPGTYVGVCQRLSDCGCPIATTPNACARMLQDAEKQGKAMAAQFGITVNIEVDESMLFAAANSNCEQVCGEFGQQAGGSVKVNAPGARVNAGPSSASVHVGDEDVQIDMQVGPNGASIKITEDSGL